MQLIVEMHNSRSFKILHYNFFEKDYCIFENNERYNISEQISNQIINENAHEFRFTFNIENDKINKIDFHDIQ